MLMLTLDDAVRVTRQLVIDQIDDEDIIRQELEQKCLIGPKGSTQRLRRLISEINPSEICSQIESDNLIQWCKNIQADMEMARLELP